VFLQDLSKRHIANTDAFRRACQNLENDGLGEYGKRSIVGSSSKSRAFAKVELVENYGSDQSSIEIVNKLLKYSVGATEYINSCKLPNYSKKEYDKKNTSSNSFISSDEENKLPYSLNNSKQKNSRKRNSSQLEEGICYTLNSSKKSNVEYISD